MYPLIGGAFQALADEKEAPNSAYLLKMLPFQQLGAKTPKVNQIAACKQ